MTRTYKIGDVLRLDINTLDRLDKDEEFTISEVNDQTNIRFTDARTAGVWTAPFLNENFTLIKEGEGKIYKVPTRTRIMTMKVVDDVAQVTCGCFIGTCDETIAKAQSKGREDYIYAAKLLREIAQAAGYQLEIRRPKLGEVWNNTEGDFLVTTSQEGRHLYHWVNIRTGATSMSWNKDKEDLGSMSFVRSNVLPT